MSEDELKEAVKEVLENSGEYRKLKAEMRTAVYKSLVKASDGEKGASQPQTESESLRLSDAVVMEYLSWKGFDYTSQMFETECGVQVAGIPTRCQLLEKLGIADTEESSKVPLLLGIIEHFRNDNAARRIEMEISASSSLSNEESPRHKWHSEVSENIPSFGGLSTIHSDALSSPNQREQNRDYAPPYGEISAVIILSDDYANPRVKEKWPDENIAVMSRTSYFDPPGAESEPSPGAECETLDDFIDLVGNDSEDGGALMRAVRDAVLGDFKHYALMSRSEESGCSQSVSNQRECEPSFSCSCGCLPATSRSVTGTSVEERSDLDDTSSTSYRTLPPGP